MFGRTIGIVSNWAVPLEVRFLCAADSHSEKLIVVVE
jgi:hypothetical protein